MTLTNRELLKQGKTTSEWLKAGKDRRKMILWAEQNGLCILTGQPLPDDPRLFDITRVPDHPYSNGDYRDKSICRAALPRAHQAIDHGNVAWFHQLAALEQALEEVQRMRIRQGNRRDAVLRQMDDPALIPGEVDDLVATVVDQEAKLKKAISNLMQTAHPIALRAVEVPGVGDTTIGRILAEIDIQRCDYPPFKFAGYAPGSDRMRKGELDERTGRRQRGEKRPYNARLRSRLYVQGERLLMTGIGEIKRRAFPGLEADERAMAWNDLTWGERHALGMRHGEIGRTSDSRAMHYYAVDYLRRRERTETQTQWASDAHRHADAMRVMMKLFLSHLWEQWREVEGLPAPKPYANAILAHAGYISPQERGWPDA